MRKRSLESLLTGVFICTECKDGRNKQKKVWQDSLLALKSDKLFSLFCRRFKHQTSRDLNFPYHQGWDPACHLAYCRQRGLLSIYNLIISYLRAQGSKQVYEPGTVLKSIKVGLILPPIEFNGSLIVNFSRKRIRSTMSACENHPRAEWD